MQAGSGQSGLAARPSDVRSTWGYVWPVAVLFVVNCLLRVGLCILVARAHSVGDLSDADSAVLGLVSSTVVVTSLVAALVLERWARRVVKNHVALGRVDSRARRRLPLTGIFTASTLALGGIDQAASPGRKPVGGLGATWSRLFWFAIIVPFAVSRFVATARAGQPGSAWSVDNLEVLTLVATVGQTFMLVVAAVVGVRTMVVIAREHAAARASFGELAYLR